MWIRSQDKTQLIKCNRIARHRDISCENNEIMIVNRFNIRGETDDFEELGRYTSRERCIEIINQIQTAIETNKKIYNMPLQ